MKTLFSALLAVSLLACSTAHGPLASKIPGDRREFEIVRVDYRPSQASARITFSSSSGIFAFDLDPAGRKLKTVTVIVNNQRYCEGLSFQDRAGHTTDLLRLQGLQVRQEGTDLVIELTPPAVDLLRDGSRVQYVNQFR